ncbi:GNAT family N-acetyltransferase [Luteococcus sediminum]
MTDAALLALYDSQLRAEAEVADADEVAKMGPVWAATFPGRGRGFVTYSHVPAGTDLDALIQAVIEHYQRDPRVDHFEWKTRGHDDLPALDETLRRHGFRFEEPETVMAGPVEAAIAAATPPPAGHIVERAATADAIREAETLAGRVFGDTAEHSSRRADELVRRFEDDPGSFEMWLVRDSAGEVVCSGRVDFVAGTDFAGLWGGACDERHRGLGLYRAITAARATSASAKGYRYLQSDCTEFSRPILERAGLVPITTTTPAVRTLQSRQATCSVSWTV